MVPGGPWSSPTTSPVHLLFLPHLQIWKGIGGHTSAVSGMRLLNLVWVLHCAKAFTAVFTSGWSIVLSLLSTDSPSQVRAAPSSCEALSLCPVLSCALLLACTMQAPSLCGGDDMVCWHSVLTGVSSWACPFYAQSCTRDDLLVSILPDRERVKG